jgi:DNA-binding CsgD family transcriptional regulator
MIESTNLAISLVNLLSLALGGLAIGLVYGLEKRGKTIFLNQYLFFLICAVIAGFCDWIIINWLLLLVPGLTSGEVDLIYHIFWDLIGFPATLFALYYLIRSLNSMLSLPYRRRNNRLVIALLFALTFLSYISFYYRLQDKENMIQTSVWYIFIFGIPFLKLSYLAFVYDRSARLGTRNLPVGKMILILLLGFLLWHLLSLLPVQYGKWEHLLIFTYYLALFLPSLYLYIKQGDLNIPGDGKVQAAAEEVFTRLNITAREKELVFLLLEGKSNQEISEELYISLQTTKNYISRIYKKIDVNNRVQLVNFFRKHGI